MSPPRPRLKKALGQHHLVDGALTRPLVDFLAPAGHRVLEVGPGGGVLTTELLAAGAAPLWAWELDPAWAAHLRRRLAVGSDPLRVVVGDALEIPWRRLPAPTLVTGNLPYNVATAILQRLLPAAPRVPRAAFLFQLEVARRLVATPGEAAYGALSVLVAARARVEILGRLAPGSFRPPPKVESAFIGLHLTPPPRSEPAMEHFTRVVHRAFGQRRKTLRNALAAGWPKGIAGAALEAAGIDPRRRAEELGLEEFLALAAQLPGEPGSPGASSATG